MYVLTIALSKYTFISTLKLIISSENIDSKHAKNHQFFTSHVLFIYSGYASYKESWHTNHHSLKLC